MIRNRSHTVWLALFAALAWTAMARAQELAPPAPPAPEPEAPEAAAAAAAAEGRPNAAVDADSTTPETEPAVVATVRDPFWPVGYEPPKQKDPEAEAVQIVEDEMAKADWPAARRKLELVAITKRGNHHYAYLREYGLVEEGNIVSVRDESFVYKFRIGAINQRGFATQQLEVRPLR